jgi:hypothetical protein
MSGACFSSRRISLKTAGLKLSDRVAFSVDSGGQVWRNAVFRQGWPLAPAFGGDGLDGARRSAAVCQQGIDGEACPRSNFKPLDFNEFRTAVDTGRPLGLKVGYRSPPSSSGRACILQSIGGRKFRRQPAIEPAK